ncbi:MAG: hypothetical protein KJ709_06600 [Nanoarchaeota archaeon]|nr:hypothetical protein [Nanoarchaeota archaeon]
MKKGAHQVDWAMSMFIFLLYLIWFFIMVQPVLKPMKDINTLMSLVEEGIDEEVLWEVQRAPLIIQTNSTEDYVPIRVSTKNWTQVSFWPSTYIAIDEGELVFMGNISPGRTYWLYNSNTSYAVPDPVPWVIADSTSATAPPTKLRAIFNSSLVSRLEYNGTKLLSFNIYINDVELPRTTTETNFTKIYAKYKLVQQGFNISSYIYQQRSELWMSFHYGTPIEMTMTTALSDYTNYYTNNLYAGRLNYTSQTCTNYSANTIDIYSETGLQFLFDRSVNMSLCAHNSSTLRMNISMFNVTEMRIVLHEGDYTHMKAGLYNHTAILGAAETITGAKWSNLIGLNNTDHWTLKQRWSVPTERDFSFSVRNSSHTSVDHSIVTPPKVDIHAITKPLLIVDEYARTNSTQLVIRVW